ncbi:Phosphoribosylglycinamide formyltransferase 2 [hydrothermal vent metagenome]|uniref:Phosphoribosylglycinamide formyltransferase 2 n=1 Tax=hydrothermal vent metagenome TaxID=652676 RepID=A0A1W1E821_9ZZZZ
MTFTTPLQQDAIKIMLLGSGELGKEVAIEAQRLGIEVIAVDKYENAPAHLVANRSYAIDMQDEAAVLELIEKEKPSYILPEVEAISISALFEAEKRGYHVIPNAEAVNKTMNRKNIRVFAAETLGLKTSTYEFVTTLDGLKAAAERMGFPCVIKPVMSSSGHGQSIAKTPDDIEKSWEIAKEARGDASELIVEEFIPFDYEITLLTVRNETGTVFCDPIGHIQQDGDFILSWQPMPMSETALQKAKQIAKAVTDGLGGRGIFGVEFFVKGEEVYFSELSPRPHDTGMVTLITQSQSEFALHVRAVLGLPLGFTTYGAGACGAYKAKHESHNPKLKIPDNAFSDTSFVRVFGKPESHIGRRMAVSLVLDEDVEAAKTRAQKIVSQIDDH